MSDKPKGKLYEMCVRGDDYTEDYDFEMFGEEIAVIMSPIVDNEFLPIASFLKGHLDMDEEEAVERVEEAKEEAEERGDDTVDVSNMDKEFVEAMQDAAKLGIVGSYDDDGNMVEYTEDDAEKMVSMMRGGYSVELGGKALEISGNVRDVKKFPGSRGSQ
ncbi:hypothetical protein [Halocatena halophila]|uniref:hypothetical protein n=1 Tax=Halocatena halophila TaxID=2814576 RepID=UPI002ED424D7